MEKNNQTCQMNTLLWNHCIPYHPELADLRSSTPVEETENTIGPYHLSEKLGAGNFASVYACQDETKAIKVLLKNTVNTFSSAKRVANEIEGLRRLRLLHEVLHTPTRIGLVMEAGPKDLFAYLDLCPKGVEESMAKSIMFQLLTAIHECHSNGIFHRDIKPENILIAPDRVVLCDFGLCGFAEEAPFREFLGSPGFFAPELLLDPPYQGDKADIWSMGIVLLEMMVGHEMFESLWLFPTFEKDQIVNKKTFQKNMERGLQKIRQVYWFSRPLQDFLGKILVLDPKKRPTIEDLACHPWLTDSPSPALSSFHSSFSSTSTSNSALSSSVVTESILPPMLPPMPSSSFEHSARKVNPHFILF